MLRTIYNAHWITSHAPEMDRRTKKRLNSIGCSIAYMFQLRLNIDEIGICSSDIIFYWIDFLAPKGALYVMVC